MAENRVVFLVVVMYIVEVNVNVRSPIILVYVLPRLLWADKAQSKIAGYIVLLMGTFATVNLTLTGLIGMKFSNL